MTDYAKNHVDVYPNAIFIDGNQVLVKKGSVNIGNKSIETDRTHIQLTLLPESVTIHASNYQRKKNNDR